ncbi:hypothetical protein F8388_006071 [Cannabis sativa]|uniref:Reverse transcriptase zinc-binding domain-containing protein n=1 Tax=Cannabis sativa TaxID=3483 RepID=A0A7J6H5Q8_CANSA|nr:hypothetical protein F8388_006071 [Cannabis sativa]KAF4404674.1 hypothetical protein G4B88_006060 [Cannabis sativa]
MRSREVICNEGMTMVGSGDSVDIWNQPWIPWLNFDEFRCLMDRVKPRFPGVNTIADISLQNGKWNTDLIKDMFGDELGERIAKINRLPVAHTDMLVWKEATDGKFSVKKAYEATQESVPDGDIKLWKKVWNSKLHYRHSFIIWRAISGCLPTRDRLGFVRDKSCLLCGEEVETAVHVLWDCNCARALWFCSPFAINGAVGGGDSVKGRVNWLLDRIPNDQTNELLSFMGCLFQGLWKNRNCNLVKGCLPNILQLRESIQRRYLEALDMLRREEVGVRLIPSVKNRGVVDMCVDVFAVSDAAWKNGRAGLAVGLLDRRDSSCKWFTKQVPASSAAEAELLAIQWAVLMAVDNNPSNLSSPSNED